MGIPYEIGSGVTLVPERSEAMTAGQVIASDKWQDSISAGPITYVLSKHRVIG